MSEYDRLWNLSRLNYQNLLLSSHCEEFIKISNQISSKNARQILWHAINLPQSFPQCACGSMLSWNSDKKQYRAFCSKKCTAVYSQKKIIDTNISKYGVSHYSKTADFKQKIKTTSFKKFSVSHFSKTKQFRQTVSNTNIEKFGSEFPSQCDSVKKKIKQTTVARYGVENVMQVPAFKEKQQLTNLTKYGSSNPNSNPRIRQKIEDTILNNYGVRFPAQNTHIQQRINNTFKNNYYNQFTYQRLHDPLWLKQQNLSGLSVSELAKMLGVSSSNLCKYFNRYGIEIKKNFRSIMEKDLTELYLNADIEVQTNVRSVISPYELDLWFPNHNVAIELNGAYYHSELQGKNKRYHLAKTEACEQRGISLLQFFDWEVFTKKDIVISRINHMLNLTKHTVGARKLTVVQLSDLEEKLFCEKNHLQGACSSKICFALTDSNNILALMSFDTGPLNKNHNWEILRFCSKLNYSIPGAANRLLMHFIKNYCNSGEKIISYCNRRWSSGQLLKTLDFKFVSTIDPDYYYINKNGAYAGTSQQWQTHKLDFFDQSLTEWQNMVNNGYDRVWDCGQKVYERTV